MKKATAIIGAGILGASLGMLFAPSTGRRTRSLIKDKAIKYSNDTVDFAGGKAVHIKNKVKGYGHHIREFFSHRFGSAPMTAS